MKTLRHGEFPVALCRDLLEGLPFPPSRRHDMTILQTIPQLCGTCEAEVDLRSAVFKNSTHTATVWSPTQGRSVRTEVSIND